MLGKVLCFLSLVLLVVCDSNWYDSEDEEDAIINYLLNGESFEMDASGETLDEPEPVLNGGIWKCGACDDMSESKLIYSEVNQIDADMDNKSVDIQVGVTLHSMRCVTVLASSAGVVRRMSGSCRGPTVTLTVLPVQHFTLQVYGE
ncbi:uncharacterized protein LOC114354010 [Ostrinia furnacalis]|uniref:uncharacterized protein LOC114354010 n=1 Tax=Ostrinia furnacalis TaxID=93504 RepID=UPI00103E60BF|nr:uncharacterized protein LOC114354010 [Ostrinia furnacalis]